MSILLIFNNQPYNGSDITWNALRLAKILNEENKNVTIFLMNDAVDLARDSTIKPEEYEFDLVQILKELYMSGISLKVCGTCLNRCGINKNKPYFNDEIKGTMKDLSNLLIECDKVLTF